MERLMTYDVISHSLTEQESGLVLRYDEFLRGGAPEIVFISGIHGDEAEVISVFQDILSDRVSRGVLNKTSLFVAEAHPEAVAFGTREGKDNEDLNRQFPVPNEIPRHPRAKLLSGMLRRHPIQWVFTIHQDNDLQRQYYTYINTKEAKNLKMEASIDRSLRWLAHGMRAAGFETFSGVDDEELGNYVHEGRVRTNSYDTSFEDWAMRSGDSGLTDVQCVVTVEIPGQASHDDKKKMLEIYFDTFIVPVISGGSYDESIHA